MKKMDAKMNLWEFYEWFEGLDHERQRLFYFVLWVLSIYERSNSK